MPILIFAPIQPAFSILEKHPITTPGIHGAWVADSDNRWNGLFCYIFLLTSK